MNRRTGRSGDDARGPRKGPGKGPGRGPGRGPGKGKPQSRETEGDRPQRGGGTEAPRERSGAPASRKPRKREAAPPPAPRLPDELRLQAYLARAGVASRRASEDLIREGRVTVDGERAEIGSKVVVARDQVRVDGALVQLQRLQWIVLNKPTGYVTTRDDPRGRKTVYDLIPAELHHLFHVGRLDRDSAGLLLLTNDGETANHLLHPRYGTTKEYWADVEGEPDDGRLRRLIDGIELEDGLAHALSARLIGETDAGTFRVEIVLREGRNREVRRMLESIGHPVQRLFRRRFGPIEIGKLRTGHWRQLTQKEIEALR